MTVLSPEQLAQLEKRLWSTADELRANSKLRASEYSTPVLGLIFLRYADVRFTQIEGELEAKATGRRKVGPKDYQARGVMYLPEEVRYLKPGDDTAEHQVRVVNGDPSDGAFADAVVAQRSS